MNVIIKGQGKVSLNQSHFKAMGGQASVYIKDGKAYKIYTDPKDTIPEAKFNELLAIQDQYVIKPQALLLDEKTNVPIGYVMDVVDGPSLCQLFTKSFRNRNKVTPQMIIDLIGDGQNHIVNVHKAGCLIVDLNENNEIVTSDFKHTCFLDVDSYQTKNYRATVLNPSVRDYSVSPVNFSEKSDWFSWAVLAFQMLIGIHPYKGTYSPYDSLDKDAKLEQRMRNNVSAFRKDVGLPGCCYPFDVIPQHYRDWLVAVLDQGKRCAPPDPKTGTPIILQAVQRAVQITTGLVITEIFNLQEPSWVFEDYIESNNKPLVMLSKGNLTKILFDGREVFCEDLPGKTIIGFTPQLASPIAVNLYRGKAKIISLTKNLHQEIELKVLDISRCEDRFYLRTASNIVELILRENGNLLITYHPVASVLEHATGLYEGCAIQNIVGSAFVSLFTASKRGMQIRVPELDQYKVVDAKYSGGVLMTIVTKGGKYYRQIFRFDEQEYDYRIINDIAITDLNFVTLPSGVCIVVTEDEKLELFASKKGSAGSKIVDDKNIGTDMKLLVVKGKAGFERNNKIYTFSLK